MSNITFILSNTSPSTIPINSVYNAEILGRDVGRTFRVDAGGSVEGLSSRVEGVSLSGVASSAVTFVRDGTTLRVEDSSGNLLASMAAGTSETTDISFTDGTTTLSADIETGLTVGGQVLASNGDSIEGNSVTKDSSNTPDDPAGGGTGPDGGGTPTDGETLTLTQALELDESDGLPDEYRIDLEVPNDYGTLTITQFETELDRYLEMEDRATNTDEIDADELVRVSVEDTTSNVMNYIDQDDYSNGLDLAERISIADGGSTEDLIIDLTPIDGDVKFDVVTGSGADYVLLNFSDLSLDSSGNPEDSFDLGEGSRDYLGFTDNVRITTEEEVAVLRNVVNVYGLAVEADGSGGIDAPTATIDASLIREAELAFGTPGEVEVTNVSSSDVIRFFYTATGANSIYMREGEQTLNLDLFANDYRAADVSNLTVQGASTLAIDSFTDERGSQSNPNLLNLDSETIGDINITGDQDLGLTIPANPVIDESGLVIDAYDFDAKLNLTASADQDIITVTGDRYIATDVTGVYLVIGDAGGIVTLNKAQTASLTGDFRLDDQSELEIYFEDASPAAGDEATISLNDADVGRVRYETPTNARTVQVSNIETLNISSTGDNDLAALVISETETLNITGDGDFKFDTGEDDNARTGDASALESVNAGTATGSLGIDLTSANEANNFDVTTGSGDDYILLKFNDLQLDASGEPQDSFDMGAGNDFLTFTDNVTITNAMEAAVFDDVRNVAGFTVEEEVQYGKGPNNPTATIDASLVNLEKLGFRTGGKVDLDQVSSSQIIFFYQTTSNAANTIEMKPGEEVLDLSLLAGENDHAEINDLDVTGASGGIDLFSLMRDEVVEINETNNVLDLDTASNSVVTVMGDQDLDLTTTTNAFIDENGLTIDASDFEAELNVTGTSGNDTITGSDGDDTITGGSGESRLTGGAGDDTFVFNAGDTGVTIADADRITDFTSGDDELDLNFGSDVTTVSDDNAAVDFGAVATLADVNFANTAGSGDDVYVSVDAFDSGNTFVFVDEDGSDALNGGDSVIELTGINALADFDVAADIT